MASKLFFDPIHGFVEVPRGLPLQLIDHPYLQRLRRIQQLGLSSMVFPGAIHSRFSHTLGALAMVTEALRSLREKGVYISEAEWEATQIAILLHDVGHGPFSHALEHVLVPGLHHEDMSWALMRRLNRETHGRLELALQIFKGRYAGTYLCQLISSQLDMDRLDYLVRDSFFTGVQEGKVGTDRILKTLNVANNQLVVEHKGIYAIEKFLIARRLMYWQVYLHKTAVAAEHMLIAILRRARYLLLAGHGLYCDETLRHLMTLEAAPEELTDDLVDRYIRLDDSDIWFHIKKWADDEDKALALLCQGVLYRRLLKIQLQDTPYDPELVEELKTKAAHKLGLDTEAAGLFVHTDRIANTAYAEGPNTHPITLLYKDGTTLPITQASDMQLLQQLTTSVQKYYLCYPGQLSD